MRIIIKLKTLLLLLSLPFVSTFSQVTMGNSEQPEKGALLQLKDKFGVTDGSANATKGIILPRVELQDLAKLQMGATAPDLTPTGAIEHIGLCVYNTTDKGDICPGLYVWDSKKWQKVGEGCMELTVSPDGTLYFASGQNGSIIVPQKLNLKWFPTTGTATWASTGITFTATPAAPWTTTPQNNVEFTPGAMTTAEVDATMGNPFLSKTGEITLTLTDGSKIKNQKIEVTQTNKALIVGTPYKEYSVSTTGETNKLTTNADFKVSYLPADGTNAISKVTLDGTTIPSAVTGYEKNDGTGKTGNLKYDVTAAGTGKARYSFLIFSDTRTPKRFLDVSLTVMQCNSTTSQQPTIDEWALIAGFTQAEIDAVKAKTAPNDFGRSSRILPNGIQMHHQTSSARDGANKTDSQIFLSSNFGVNPGDSDERWMIQNLDATSYDGVIHSAVPARALTGPNGNTGNAYNTAYWGYPNGGTNAATATDYNRNPRLGLLYTWDAATAGKGGSNGQANLGEEGATVPTVATRVQGICPKGWHLPSDYEWTDLENQIITRTRSFSTTDNIGGTPIPQDNTTTGYRGTLHGKAMQEACQQYGTQYVGTSNSITPALRPGFEAFLAGYASNGTTIYYGQFGYFSSASSNTSFWIWNRYVNDGDKRVFRGIKRRYDLISVRCKKDH